MDIKITRINLRKSKGKLDFVDQISELHESPAVAKDMDNHILAALQNQQKNNEREVKKDDKSTK